MTRRSFFLSHLPLVAVTASLLLAGATAYAQSKAAIYIPFSFTANHQTLPAGHYSLELLSDRFLCFTDSRTGQHQGVIMVRPEPGNYIETRGRLRFASGANRQYLMEVRFAGSSMHSVPVISRSLERELTKNPQANPSTEIAMK